MSGSASVEEMTARLTGALAHTEDWHPTVLRSHPELAGWAGLDLPLRVDGRAWPARQMASLFRNGGRIDMELRDLIGAGHARLLTLVKQRGFDDLLRNVAAGRAYCAIALTEPNTGSDLGAIETRAVSDGDNYRIDGEKYLISRISEATHFIVFAAVQREGLGSPVTAFVLPRDVPGLSIEEIEPMGLKKVSWGRVKMAGVMVPASARIGGEGYGIALFQRHFSYWRTMMAAAAVGCAEAAVDEATERLKTRRSFGGPIGRFSHLQQGLARQAAQLRMAWLLVDDVATMIDSRDVARPWPVFDAAMAKAEAIEIALDATEWAMNVFGGEVYAAESGIQKRHRDLTGLRFADGTTDVLRGQVARSILGERLYELSLNRNEGNNFDDTASRKFW